MLKGAAVISLMVLLTSCAAHETENMNMGGPRDAGAATSCDDAIHVLRNRPHNPGEVLVVLDGQFTPSDEERVVPNPSPYRGPYTLVRVVDRKDPAEIPDAGDLVFDIWWNDSDVYLPPVPEGHWRIAAYVLATEHRDLLLGPFELCGE